MGDDPGRSESGEEEEDFGSEDDDIITPLQDRLSWKSFFGRWLFSINIFLYIAYVCACQTPSSVVMCLKHQHFGCFIHTVGFRYDFLLFVS